MKTHPWACEYFDSVRMRWVLWGHYDSQHSAECAAGMVRALDVAWEVRIWCDDEPDLFQGKEPAK